MIITTYMAANVLARHWQRLRTRYFDHELGKRPLKLDPPNVPNIDEIRREALAFLERNAFTSMNFATESAGGCDTCHYEYPAIGFFGARKKYSIMDIDVSDSGGTTLTDIYEWLSEGERREKAGIV